MEDNDSMLNPTEVETGDVVREPYGGRLAEVTDVTVELYEIEGETGRTETCVDPFLRVRILGDVEDGMSGELTLPADDVSFVAKRTPR